MPIEGLSDKMRISRAGFLRIGKRRPCKKARVIVEGRSGAPVEGKIVDRAPDAPDAWVVEFTSGEGTRQVTLRQDQFELAPHSGSPEKVDHFRFDPDNPDLKPVLATMFGDAPKAVPIVFPVDDGVLDEHKILHFETVFPQWLTRYTSGGGLVCMGRGGGLPVERAVDDKGNLIEGLICDPTTCPHWANQYCRRVARLQFMIRGLAILSVWQINTGSKTSIEQINGKLRVLKQMFGKVNGIPLVLTVAPRQMKTPEGKKVVSYVLDIDLDPTADLNATDPRVMLGIGTMPAVDTSLPIEHYPAISDAVDGRTGQLPALGYDDIPADLKTAGQILNWPPGKLVAELMQFQRVGDPTVPIDATQRLTTLDIDAATSFLSHKIDQLEVTGAGQGGDPGPAAPAASTTPAAKPEAPRQAEDAAVPAEDAVAEGDDPLGF